MYLLKSTKHTLRVWNNHQHEAETYDTASATNRRETYRPRWIARPTYNKPPSEGRRMFLSQILQTYKLVTEKVIVAV